jgi:hypothetical protein
MTAMAHHPDRVCSAVAAVRRELAAVTEAPVWSLDAVGTAAVVEEITRAEAQLAELKARVLAHADRTRIAADTGTSSTAHWHAARTRTTRAQAHRSMRLAAGLETFDATRSALATGALLAEQAEAIVQALGELPDDLDPDVARQAEEALLELAGQHDAKALRLLGRRILKVVDPDAADAHEAKLLEREEREAEAALRLTVWDGPAGRLQGRFTLDALSGAMFKKALHAFAAPRHRAASGPLDNPKPTPERLGRAFAEMIQRYPVKKLPRTGGMSATVVVTMTLDALLGGLKAAELDTGGKLSAGQARRLACEAGIIPAVLGGRSQVLDIGRRKRRFTEAQRLAKLLEAHTCEVEGCDRPAGATHVHHLKAWAQGGRTDLANAMLICPWHHARAHDSRYDMKRLPTGKYTFHRRC